MSWGGAVRRGREGPKTEKAGAPTLFIFGLFLVVENQFLEPAKGGTPTRAKHVDKKKGNINKTKTENTAKLSKTQQNTRQHPARPNTHPTHTQHTTNNKPRKSMKIWITHTMKKSGSHPRKSEPHPTNTTSSSPLFPLTPPHTLTRTTHTYTQHTQHSQHTTQVVRFCPILNFGHFWAPSLVTLLTIQNVINTLKP